jgi:hypothetical protein
VVADENRVSVRIAAADNALDVTVDGVVSRGTHHAVDLRASDLELARVANIDHDTKVEGEGLWVAGRHIPWAAIGAVAASIMIPTAILIAILS